MNEEIEFEERPVKLLQNKFDNFLINKIHFFFFFEKTNYRI
jgi:hypothetical protein